MHTQPLIGLTETLTVGSIEGFLTHREAADLTAIMDEFLTNTPRSVFGTRRKTSIHEIPGHDTAEAMSIYEPAGRLEITEIPTAAEQLLQQAFTRAHPILASTLPSVTSCRPWTYVEYGAGQHITAHIDGIAPNPQCWPRQIAGISVSIGELGHGGDFFVETTSDPRIWNEACSVGDGYDPAMRFAHDGADNSSDWFRSMPRTRWSVAPAAGTALLYGSQLTHGTHPVTGGHARKFISWLFADNTQPA